jgi:hypothetical protein
MRVLKFGWTALFSFAISGCDAIGAIFKAGMWVGVIAILVVVFAVWFLASRFR